jgi:hypothetical protein
MITEREAREIEYEDERDRSYDELRWRSERTAGALVSSRGLLLMAIERWQLSGEQRALCENQVADIEHVLRAGRLPLPFGFTD